MAGAVFGVGMHPNIITASVLAVISGLNRACLRLPEAEHAKFFNVEAGAVAVG
jgi:2-isopropylmalate synthase